MTDTKFPVWTSYMLRVGETKLMNPEMPRARARRESDEKVLLFSRRAAARLLTIDRGTLSVLIQRGLVRTVQKGRSTAIPRSEVDRLARDGIPDVHEAPRKRQGRQKRAVSPAAAIRKLDVKKLKPR
jgi:hypothetical protein